MQYHILTRLTLRLSLGSVLLSLPVAEVFAACPPSTPPVAHLVALQGRVELNSVRAQRGAPICPGDVLRVGSRSRAAVVFMENENVLRIDENTELRVAPPPDRASSFIEIIKGGIHFFSPQPRSLEINTPFLNALVEGTEFFLRVREHDAQIGVFAGRVTAQNEQGRIALTDGQTAIAAKGAAPVMQVVVKPRDAVQWALYYPPIVGEGTDGAVAPVVQEAVDAYLQGDISRALQGLDRVAETRRDSAYWLFRANLLLTVGRADEARRAIDLALDQDPQSSGVYALKAVIDVAQNRPREALENGHRAVDLDPQSATARVALSYALQANFELEAARDTLRQAVRDHPAHTLAWVRLAELWLSLGHLNRAVEAAARAVEAGNQPLPSATEARSNMVFGFAALAQVRLAEATDAFVRAIELNSEDPLPHLGLGLAKIREGELQEGRRHIATAVALDPNNALLRSYLGKVYFEEKRAPLDARQFAIAKELDPNDPTPWLYDAIRKQTQNRPMDSVQDLQKSIALNDNRAVYRSRLLLDEDLAVRAISLARAFDNIGFDQLALIQSRKSLSLDPTNHSAHRFLSDSYARQTRHEIARASELLQAQLLQPINRDPVQPNVVETDLNILTSSSVADPSFNEFGPLFQSNGISVVASGIVGNRSTLGDEISIAGIVDRFSYRFGQYHYESDGFRENSDVEHDIYNIFGQIDLNSLFSTQIEYRHRDTAQGDLRLNFDPADFSSSRRQASEDRTIRIGSHLNLSPRADLIASLAYNEFENDFFDDAVGFRSIGDSKGYDAQVQYLRKGNPHSLITGLSFTDIDVDLRVSVDQLFELFPDVSVQHYNGYLYLNLAPQRSTIWTLGASYDAFESGSYDVDSTNPKAGLQWNVREGLDLRFAYFETIKRDLILQQTLEPTQIAGFNQFFDDVDGTQAKRYGAGADITLGANLYSGIELSKRVLTIPIVMLFTGDLIRLDEEEKLARLYLYWTPNSNWALRAELEREEFDSNPSPVVNLPSAIETTTLPLSIRYFDAKGWFSELSATFVKQNVELPESSTFTENEDEFVLVDAAIGYRLKKRRGIASLEVKNIFDKKFLFQDLNIQSQEPSNPRFIADRTVLVRLTLNF